MLFSNSRKLSLSGWLQVRDSHAYSSSLRLQKFLFLYEAFSKADGDSADFSKLKGYVKGPVFSSVYGDYTKDRPEFNTKSYEAYRSGKEKINETRAERARFIVSSLTEDELSELTHKFNIWNSKRNRIMAREYQVALDEDDFNEGDFSTAHALETMFPEEVISACDIVSIGDKNFVLSKSDIKSLSEQQLETLMALSDAKNLRNPVYVSLDEGGRMCVD